MKNFVHKGKTLTITAAPRTGYSGDGLQVGALFGIAAWDYTIGLPVEVDVEGVFTIPKDASAFNVGDRVFWDNVNFVCTSNLNQSTGVPNMAIGLAELAQVTGDATVQVRLDYAKPLITSADLDPTIQQVAIVPLTAANILGMYAAPVAVLPAPGAGKCILVDALALEFTPGNIAFASGGPVSVNYAGGAAVHTGTVPAATINAAANGAKTLTQLGMQTGASGLAAPANTGLTVGNATGAFTTGNGVAYLIIYYSIVTLQ
jgi:predicted RecA/RadA family phage recombinase